MLLMLTASLLLSAVYAEPYNHCIFAIDTVLNAHSNIVILANYYHTSKYLYN